MNRGRKLVFLVFILLLLPCLTTGVPLSRGESGAFQDNTFNHFWLVLTWAPTFCEQNLRTFCERNRRTFCEQRLRTFCERNRRTFCEQRLRTFCEQTLRSWTMPAEFTIHGLWPVTESGSTLTEVVQPNADLRWLFDRHLALVQDLTVYWPSLGQRSNEEFWMYQWSKHGCTQIDISPQQYFQSAVSMRERAGDIVAALRNEGVIPDNTARHSVTKYVDAIKATTGVGEVILICNEEALYELRICVNCDATALIDCNPYEIAKSCKETEVLLPTMPRREKVFAPFRERAP